MFNKTAAALVATMALGGVLVATDAMAAQQARRSNVGVVSNHARAAGPAHVGRTATINRGIPRNARSAIYRGRHYGRDVGYSAAYRYGPTYESYESGPTDEYVPAYGYENSYGPVPCLSFPVPVIGCM
jgi:hypothetical protein